MTPSSELAILRFLGTCIHATAPEIGIACRMTAAEVRARLVMLEGQRLVASRPDPNAPHGKLRRVYLVTGEGRRKAEISDTRHTANGKP